MTRDEWRTLRFFYDRDDDAHIWRLSGSRDGLKHFATLLRNYASKPTNSVISEHDHYGPYMYLKVMTWPDAGIGENAIHGTLDDLKRLADIVEQKIESTGVGVTVSIAHEYVDKPDYDLVLEVHADDTDPSSFDSCLRAE